MTHGIFASPTHVAPHARAARPSKPLTKSIKLVVTDADGKVLLSLNLKQPKSTLGCSESCNICCPLPGIAPVHALIVNGARQSFVRSLAGKLSQDGIPATELLLSDQKSYFELAGYRFTLLRSVDDQADLEQIQAKRMRFALARPMSISAPSDTQTADAEGQEKSLNAPWVANIIREAIEPLEAQIDSLLLPLAEFQAQSMQAQIAVAKELEEEKRKVELERQRAFEEELKAKQIEAERLKLNDEERAAKEREIVSMVAQQSASMEMLTERIGDVNNQLTTIERIIAQDADLNANNNATTAQVVAIQQTAIEQLQTGMVSVSESLKHLQERQQAAHADNLSWKNEVQLQLQQLTSAVSEFSDIAKNNNQPELIDALESLKHTHEAAQIEINRWQEGVQQQLVVLQDKLDDATKEKHEQIPQKLAEALTEIQAKHEQSLAELQIWKEELRLEIQQVLSSTSRPAIEPSPIQQPLNVATIQAPAQAELPAENQVSPSPMLETPKEQFDSPRVENGYTQNPSYGGDQDFYFGSDSLSSSQSTSAVVQQDFFPEYLESVSPEIVNDEMVKQASSNFGQEWSSEDNSITTSNTAWPTISTGESLDQSSGDFGDQWSSQSQPGVFENNFNTFAERSSPSPTPNPPAPSSASMPGQNSSARNSSGQPVDPWPTSNAGENYFETMAEASPFEPNVPPAQMSIAAESPTINRSQLSNEIDTGLGDLFPSWNLDQAGLINQSTPESAVPVSNSPVVQSPVDPGSIFAPQAVANSSNSSAELSQQNLIPPSFDPGVSSIQTSLNLGSQQQVNSQLNHEEIATSSDSIESQRSESGLPSWWIENPSDFNVEADNNDATQSKAQHSVNPERLQFSSDAQPTDIERIYKDVNVQPQASPTASAVKSSQQSSPREANRFASFDRFVEREQQLDSQLIAENSSLENSPVGALVAPEESAESRIPAEVPAPRDSTLPAWLESYEQTAIEDEQNAQQKNLERQQSQPMQQVRAAVSPSAHAGSTANTHDGDEEESVEAYMKNLLARMRGEQSDSTPVSAPAPVESASSSTITQVRTSPYELRNAMLAERAAESAESTDPIDLDSYVPLTNAPEKTKNISAFRELANSSARTAIHKSTRRRTLSGSLMKFAISAIALTVAAALFAINGVNINIALVATMAALFVAMIWGYDGFKSLKPLLQNSLVLQPDSNPDMQDDDE